MNSTFLGFLVALVGILLFFASFNALLRCAAELKKIREHLDRLTPEALLALKTARRANAEGQQGV